MIFGDTPLAEAEGAILAHSLKLAKLSFKKGRRLSAEDVAALEAEGLASVVAARLEEGDRHEDEDVDRLDAEHIAEEGRLEVAREPAVARDQGNRRRRTRVALAEDHSRAASAGAISRRGRSATPSRRSTP